MKREKVGTDQLAALGLTVIVASLAVGLLAIGCGQQQSETANTEVGTVQTAGAGKAPVAANAAAPATGNSEAGPKSEETTTAAADAMPPDILATASSDYAAPGQIVEITAQGTTDVVEVNLRDGRGKSIPLVYDAAAAQWRGRYRVPLRPETERIGLSVTAKNAENLRHRVWVFLQIEKAAGETAEPDSQ